VVEGLDGRIEWEVLVLRDVGVVEGRAAERRRAPALVIEDREGDESPVAAAGRIDGEERLVGLLEQAGRDRNKRVDAAAVPRTGSEAGPLPGPRAPRQETFVDRRQKQRRDQREDHANEAHVAGDRTRHRGRFVVLVDAGPGRYPPAPRSQPVRGLETPIKE
jgi:hypothetical protein